MRSQLASYISTKPSFSNLTEAEEFRNALPSYHVKGYALSTKSLQEDFYSNFKKEHFVQTRNEDEKEGSAYIRPMSIHPKDLYTFNKEGFDNFRNSIANIAALCQGKGMFNQMKTHKDEDQAKMRIKEKKPVVWRFITACFHFAWQFQADGEQSNATLTPGSIRKIVEKLANEKYIKSGDKILDCGSSYGSLLLIMLNELENKNITATGYGIEYALIRHILGCITFCKMLKKMKDMEYIPIPNTNVQLINEDLYKIRKYQDNTNLAFSFDKAFPGDLILHIILCVINSKIPYFLTVRGSFCKENHLCQLEQDKAGGFRLDELLTHMNFELKEQISGLKMNGGENAGTFKLYKVPILQNDVDGKFIMDLYTNFFKSRNTISLEAMKRKITQWETTPITKLNNNSFPGSPTSEYLEQYYKKESCFSNLIDDKRDRNNNQIPPCCTLSAQFMCCDYCKDCKLRFPTEDKAKNDLTDVKKTKNNTGKGLFAKEAIKEESYICQYQGKRDPSEKAGMYHARVEAGYVIDARNSKSVGRYANHSCKPNCEFITVSKELVHSEENNKKTKKKTKKKYHEASLWIRAIRDIRSGEEITVHYGDEYLSFFPNKQCLCSHCHKPSKKRHASSASRTAKHRKRP